MIAHFTVIKLLDGFDFLGFYYYSFIINRSINFSVYVLSN